jgi:isoleucyl-tRNA synthetase
VEAKDTLNLPKTEFPMKGNLAKREPEILVEWSRMGLYDKVQAARAGAPKFILHDGPPYSNGHIHYGHILNKILKDIVVKYQTMIGKSSTYVPGWDTHGLPIELAVERDLGDKRKGMSALEIRQACQAYALRQVDIQREEFKRLGVFGTWDNPYLTLSHSYEAAIVRALAAFARGGYLYRDKRPVHWCPTDATALAEAEIEYKDHTSPSVYVRFPMADFDAAKLDEQLAGKSLSLIIWTTTPWTLPANLAVVLHPDLPYVALPSGKTAGEYYLVARGRAEAFLAAIGQTVDPEQWIAIHPDKLRAVEGARYQHPLVPVPKADADFRVWFAKHVTLEQGTGLVHTAPGHGAEDAQVGREHGLDLYAPIDDYGKFTADVPEWKGLRTHDANPKIIERLVELGALLNPKTDSVRHSYPHCWRCKKPVLFRATEQWFCSMAHQELRQRALDEIDRTEWVPPWGRNRIYGMIEHRPDWCLSRQRIWGTPIPIPFCAACNKPVVKPEAMEHAADIFAKEGADAWYARPIEELVPPGLACEACGSTQLRKENAIVDVWFESGVSWLAVCASNPELGQPVDLYLEGSDQHRGWFHSSLLTAIGVVGHAPYKTVLTHGFVLDENGNPYSKSAIEAARAAGKKIEYIPPPDIIQSQGAEIFRLWAASTEFRSDIPYSKNLFAQLAEAYRKYRNTCRYVLSNLFDFDPARHTLDHAELQPLDRRALARLGDVVFEVRRAYAAYELTTVFRTLLDYVTVDLSAVYLDVVKDRLYCDAADSPSRRAAQTVLYAIGRALAKLAAPILCFTAEDVWKHLPKMADDPESVHLAILPVGAKLDPEDPLAVEWTTLFAYRERVLKAMEAFRAEKHHPLDAEVTIRPAAADRTLLERELARLPDLFVVSRVVIGDDAAEPAISVRQAPGNRCERCWKYTDAAPPYCARCQPIVARHEAATQAQA